MRKCRQYVLGLMMAAAVLSMTACGRNDNNTGNNNTSSTGQTTAGSNNGSTGTVGTTGNGNEARSGITEESGNETTGVIDGMMDDVKQGVDDLMGENGTTASTATQATDK